MTGFPPYVLRDYAFIADGERGAVLGPRGDISWLCVPTWSSDAVFSSLVGGAGIYAITPTDERFVDGGYYEQGTLVWHNRWTTTHGVTECCDALSTPADPRITRIIRRVVAADGDARVRIVLDARANFGKDSSTLAVLEDDVWTFRSGDLYARWSGASAAKVRPDGAFEFELTVPNGSHHDLVLELSGHEITKALVPASVLWANTRSTWSRTAAIRGTVADRDAAHAAAILRGLTSAGGGMVAGATMALPEHYESARNYDYRYAWIRDQCYAGQAAAVAGQFDLLDAAVRFVTERLLSDGSKLKPAYTVAGHSVPDQRTLDLSGYPGGSDRVGNWVNKQFQLDAFGEALLLFSAAARADRLTSENWSAASCAVDAIERLHANPDAGIWELQPQHWTHSRLTCVAGLRNIARLAPAAEAARWAALADAIMVATSTNSLHSSGRWQRTPTDPRVDSALLIPAIRGAVPANDPRSIATLEAALAELSQDEYMYRFRQHDLPLGSNEGAFLLCGFVTSLALHQQGREVEAARWFERNRGACGTAGILAEEFAVQQRQMRGNFPQAFVHALLLESSVRLADRWPLPE